VFQDVRDLFENVNENCNIEFKAHVDAMFSAQFTIHGAGYGEVCVFLFQMATM